MRTGARDVLLFLLAITSGSADGWSYFGLAHAFVANMTGNTVLLGMSVFLDRQHLLQPAIALSAYVTGVAIASAFLGKRVSSDQKIVWSRSVSAVLLAEAALLAAAQTTWVLEHHSRGSHIVLLATVAVAIGLQSGAMVQLQVPGIVTTYITGTWTTMTYGLARLFFGGRSQSAEQTRSFEERLLLQAAVLAFYLLSAIFTGWLFEHAPASVGLLPTLCLLLVASYGLITGDRYSVSS